MQDSKNIKFNGKEITVSELTVKQARETLTNIDKSAPKFLDELLDVPIPVAVISAATGISCADLEECKPSLLLELVEGVTEVNPLFASMIKRRVEAYSKMMAKISGSSLTELSAS